jgi:hypothetical protein
VLGPAVAAGGFVLLSLPGIGCSYWTTFLPGIVVLGIGMAVCVTPLVTGVMGSANTSHTGAASGVNNAISRTASLLAIPIMGVAAIAAFGSTLDNKLAAIDAPAPVVARLDEQRTQLAGIELPTGLAPELVTSLERAIDESFVSDFRLVMLLGADLALSSAVISLVYIQYRPAGQPAPAD